jgi:hypothetical protein
MDYIEASRSETRQRAYIFRSSVAERWGRKVLWFTAIVGFFAVWHERDLAPPVHDGMVFVSDVAVDIFNGAEETPGMLESMFNGPTGVEAQHEFNALTRWLLDNRN